MLVCLNNKVYNDWVGAEVGGSHAGFSHCCRWLNLLSNHHQDQHLKRNATSSNSTCTVWTATMPSPPHLPKHVNEGERPIGGHCHRLYPSDPTVCKVQRCLLQICAVDFEMEVVVDGHLPRGRLSHVLPLQGWRGPQLDGDDACVACARGMRPCAALCAGPAQALHTGVPRGCRCR